MVGRPVIISLKGVKLHFHALIRALFQFQFCYSMVQHIVYTYRSFSSIIFADLTITIILFECPSLILQGFCTYAVFQSKHKTESEETSAMKKSENSICPRKISLILRKILLGIRISVGGGFCEFRVRMCNLFS